MTAADRLQLRAAAVAILLGFALAAIGATGHGSWPTAVAITATVLLTARKEAT